MRQSGKIRVVSRLLIVACSLSVLAVAVLAQQPPGATQPRTSTTPSAAANEPQQVVIEREPLLLKPAETYHVPLKLVPAKSVDMAARFNGVVNAILIKRGEVARSQAEVIRLDAQERQLEMDRAKAAYQAAKLEQESAEQGTAREIATAKLDVAKADLDLAEFRLNQCNLRAPFDGVIQEVHAVEGEFIQTGQPLATLVDKSTMMVQVPIDRLKTKEGDTIQLQIEGKVATAKIEGILPLTEPFEPLRELFQSIATGIAVLDNGAGQWESGQTVQTSLIPRSPVTEIPNIALVNGADGTRRVRVIRDGFVREVPVELLGAVGEERTIVTGAFGTSDELIVRSSEELKDGTQVVPRTELAADGPASSNSTSPRPATLPRVTPPPPK
ncbi:MAG: HlyD family efflux transporter periplasmic adaptor subunit [Planctomycetaceae bacterium]|nr:HlyD family efflux transporter periplasmic adaptor subunit [Planctomycetaceae bacterium]MCA9109854.1 HlyD family efflux transporter periplasmic adaptor subunit [Planctomycetaceae bacterium]